MTKAEPVVVKSLRELDILVHERVLGWHFDASVPGWWHESWTPELKKLELEVMAQTERYKDGPAADEVFPPHYSTEIAAAWKVVEKFAHTADVHRCPAGWWNCELQMGVSSQAGEACERTTQLAISIAALKTKDIEVTLAWK